MLGQPHLTEQGDETVLYFWGINTNHNGVLDPDAVGPGDNGNGVRAAIASVRMRLDGFAHIAATSSPAVVLTKPLTFSGNALLLNAAASGAGQVMAEMLPPGSANAIASSEPFTGDAVNATVAWVGGAEVVASLAGKVVQLRFTMVGQGVELYSFQFAQQ